MKELLFRGRFKVNKFRWNGTPREYEFIESKTHHISAINFNNNGDISHVVIPYKDTCITLFPDYFTTFDIQQYTGLTDKNGIKIYEGDICKHHSSAYKNNLVSTWVDSQSCFSFIDRCDFDQHFYLQDIDMRHVEVIGNIHDNKDLIK